MVWLKTETINPADFTRAKKDLKGKVNQVDIEDPHKGGTKRLFIKVDNNILALSLSDSVKVRHHGKFNKPVEVRDKDGNNHYVSISGNEYKIAPNPNKSSQAQQFSSLASELANQQEKIDQDLPSISDLFNRGKKAVTHMLYEVGEEIEAVVDPASLSAFKKQDNKERQSFLDANVQKKVFHDIEGLTACYYYLKYLNRMSEDIKLLIGDEPLEQHQELVNNLEALQDTIRDVIDNDKPLTPTLLKTLEQDVKNIKKSFKHDLNLMEAFADPEDEAAVKAIQHIKRRVKEVSSGLNEQAKIMQHHAAPETKNALSQFIHSAKRFCQKVAASLGMNVKPQFVKHFEHKKGFAHVTKEARVAKELHIEPNNQHRTIKQDKKK